jgi:hypothetical protein
MQNQKLAQAFKIAGLALISLEIAFLLFMGIGEMVSGDFSGISHVIPALVLGGLVAWGLKSPRGGGMALAVVGLLIAVYFLAQTSPLQARLTAILFTGAPILLSGLLLAASGRDERAEQV